MFAPPVAHPALFARRGLMPASQGDAPPAPNTTTPVRHPAARAPRIFADSATLHEVEPLFRAGIISGLTTNPTLLRKAGASSWDRAKEIMRELCGMFHPHPVSLELTALDEEGMVAQASELAALGDNAVIKVPVGGFRALNPNADPYTGLKVIHRLWRRGVRVNTTLIFNTAQALWAANAGAAYVSPFLGRLTDYARAHDAHDMPPGSSLSWSADDGPGAEAEYETAYVACGGPIRDIGSRLVFEIATVFANYRITTEILAASIRTPGQMTECFVAGADVVTVPAAVLAKVADHPLSDSGLASFAKDAATFEAGGPPR